MASFTKTKKLKFLSSSLFTVVVSSFVITFISFPGGIFHESNYDAEVAFKYAIDRVNMYNKDFEISPIIKTIASTDSFKAGKISKFEASDYY